jgi:outer membrane lipoprotein carrier protein
MKIWKLGSGAFTITLFAALICRGQGQPAAAGSDLSLEEIATKLQANYEKINTYTGRFEQEIWSRSTGKVVSHGEGEVKYKKPGRMVWHYQKPDEHIYINEGNTIWDYSPANKEAYQLPVRESVYKTFLLGLGDLRKDFEISFHSGRKMSADGFYQLDLVPKQDNERRVLGAITFYIDPGTFLVQRTESVDALGNRNTIKFSGIKLNVEIPDEVFRFVPPPGTKIIAPPPPPDPGKFKDKNKDKPK